MANGVLQMMPPRLTDGVRRHIVFHCNAFYSSCQRVTMRFMVDTGAKRNLQGRPMFPTTLPHGNECRQHKIKRTTLAAERLQQQCSTKLLTGLSCPSFSTLKDFPRSCTSDIRLFDTPSSLLILSLFFLEQSTLSPYIFFNNFLSISLHFLVFSILVELNSEMQVCVVARRCEPGEGTRFVSRG